jgi:hypothetical protein
VSPELIGEAPGERELKYTKLSQNLRFVSGETENRGGTTPSTVLHLQSPNPTALAKCRRSEERVCRDRDRFGCRG